jgi:excisionase family DNA binding protein
MPALLLTCREAAEAMRVSTRTLFSLTRRGEIRSIRIGCRGVRYSPADLQEWIDRQRGEPAETAT